MRKSMFKISVYLLVGTSAILFQNFITHTTNTVNNPLIYNKDLVCAVYVMRDGSNIVPTKIAEVKRVEAVKSRASCASYVEKYYGKGASGASNCGYEHSIISNGSSNTKLYAFGVIEKINGAKTQFENYRSYKAIKVSAPSDRSIASTPTQCVSKKFNFSKICNYEKNKICVLKDTPILQQNTALLAKHISKVTKNKSITKDTGWCGPVAASMSLAGAIYSSQYEIHQNEHLWSSNLPTRNTIIKNDINARTNQYANMIYNVGQTLGTNWEKGGTQTAAGLRKIYQQVDPSVRNANTKILSGKVARLFLKLEKQDLTVKSLIEKFESGYNVLVLSTQRYKQTCSYKVSEIKTNSKYKTMKAVYDCKKTDLYKHLNTSHAVSVNGIEDGYVKIYDPWGRIYNVDIKHNHSLPGIDKNVAAISVVKGDGGYIGNNMLNSNERIVEAKPGVKVNSTFDNWSARIVNVGNVNGFLARPIITMNPKK